MGYWGGGANWYDPPGSEHTFEKLWDPRIYMFPDQRHIDLWIVGNCSYVLLCEVQSVSMHSMLMLGGSGGMAPRKCLKNRCSEIESEGILESKYHRNK